MDTVKLLPSVVELFNHMGDDLSIANTARVSFDVENSEFKAEDTRLIQYLADHGHWSPFAHAIVKFRIETPIFVARQLAKHQVGFAWNEVSRRYVVYEPCFFRPDVWRGRPEASIKQGSGSAIPDAKQLQADAILERTYSVALDAYNGLLDIGVCPEQARMTLSLGAHTKFIWTGSLYGWARMCALRLKSDSQKETRDVAAAISRECKKLFPVSWSALMSASDLPEITPEGPKQ